jgi:hypothetical protein
MPNLLRSFRFGSSVAKKSVAHLPSFKLAPSTVKYFLFCLQIIMLLPDDAEVSDEIWDEVIHCIKVRVQDKIPSIRAFAVRALARFASDGEDGGILDLFLETLDTEQNAVCDIILVSS